MRLEASTDTILMSEFDPYSCFQQMATLPNLAHAGNGECLGCLERALLFAHCGGRCERVIRDRSRRMRQADYLTSFFGAILKSRSDLGQQGFRRVTQRRPARLTRDRLSFLPR